MYFCNPNMEIFKNMKNVIKPQTFYSDKLESLGIEALRVVYSMNLAKLQFSDLEARRKDG